MRRFVILFLPVVVIAARKKLGAEQWVIWRGERYVVALL